MKTASNRSLDDFNARNSVFESYRVTVLGEIDELLAINHFYSTSHSITHLTFRLNFACTPLLNKNPIYKHRNQPLTTVEMKFND